MSLDRFPHRRALASALLAWCAACHADVRRSARTGADTLRYALGAPTDFTDETGVAWRSVATLAIADGAPIAAPDRLVFGTRRPRLYRTAREGVTAVRVPVEPGAYTVVLHFAELSDDVVAPGQRVFDVDVEGQRPALLDAVDPWGASGGQRVPLVESVRAVVRDGELTVRLTARTPRPPVVGAIEILRDGPDADAAPPGAQDVRTLADFEQRDDDELRRTFVLGQRGRRGAIALAPHGAGRALRWDYRVDASIGYGDRSDVSAQAFVDAPLDLAGSDAIRLWLRPDGSGRSLYLQLLGVSGWWNYDVAMTGTSGRWITIPLSAFGKGHMPFISRPGPPTGKLKGIGLFVQHVPGRELGGGTVFVDDVQLVRAAAPAHWPEHRMRQRQDTTSATLDDFESYGNDDDLQGTFGNIVHGHMCTTTLDRRARPGQQALRLDYGFGRSDYSGFVVLPRADWRAYNAFRFWIAPDGSRNTLHTIFISHGSWEHELPLTTKTPGWIEVPFPDLFGDAADLSRIEEIMIRVRHEPGGAPEGTIVLDDLQAIRSDRYPTTLPSLPPPPLLPGDAPTRIDSGATVDHRDGDGRMWLSDRGYEWGNRVGKAGCGFPFVLRDVADRDLYCTERVGFSGYRFFIPNGRYRVRVHFVENWHAITAPGERRFTLDFNGEPAGDVDPFADGGGKHATSVREREVDVVDGNLAIHLAGKAAQPRVAALEILPVPSAARR